jgi:hypothetical protein
MLEDYKLFGFDEDVLLVKHKIYEEIIAAVSHTDTEVGGISGLMSNYVYSATNVRLQELSVGYSLPAKWFNNKCIKSCNRRLAK